MVGIFLFCQPVNKPRSFISVAKQGSKSVATKEEKRGRVGKGRSYTSAIAISTTLNWLVRAG